MACCLVSTIRPTSCSSSGICALLRPAQLLLRNPAGQARPPSLRADRARHRRRMRHPRRRQSGRSAQRSHACAEGASCARLS
eukprot:2115788-Prymnesium_polylepis.1